MTTTSPLRWGILATGNIARTFAQALPHSRTGRLVAIGSRTQASADAFAAEFPCRAHGSYSALLADPEVEAVYISTPHPQHVEWAVAAARAGKHILCEKPIALNLAEAMIIAESARRHGVFLMEAFMYRCHPQTAKIVEIVRSGRLGEVRVINAAFGWDAGSFQPESRLFNHALGGGAILDVGCYCASMARLVAGAAAGRPYLDPVQVKAVGHLAESGVDDYAQALLTFDGGVQAHLVTATRAAVGASVTIVGSKGTLRVPSPWFCDVKQKLELESDGKVEAIAVPDVGGLYTFEIDALAEHRAQGEAPFMPVGDTLGNMATLDRWRAEIGLTYRMEQLKAPRPGFSLRRPGTREVPHLRGTIPGLDPKKQPSRMVMGTMLEGSAIPVPHGFALYDYFYEWGGRTFDTAWVYAGGLGEQVFGDWMKQRGVREEVVVIAKGAHTPYCDPASFRLQLAESLERLQTDYADIYLLHRDNRAIPVGEFVDAMNEQARAGRIRIFGGSNWSLARIREANAYAAARGLQGFGAVSNQLSLARMIDPIWADGVSAFDPEFRAWHRETSTPLFAWSSQARGFFVRAAREFTADAELVRCWYSDDNFERLERVRQLAREKKTDPINIAAAYVLQQPFPVFALIGPRSLSETESCFHAFDLSLTPAEVAWLNLERQDR